MSDTLTIRPALENDAEAVARLVRAHAAEDGEMTGVTSEFVRRYMAAPASAILLAERGRRLVGLVSYSLRPDLLHAGPACLMEELFVVPEDRSGGVGRALLAALGKRMEQEGWAELAVSVMPGNERAIRFYKAQGLLEEALLLEKHREIRT
jgi:ribosomal protein S18 acetylase RimI-like enzyme